ncbi:MAG: UPF0158 family protein [Bacteroidota bacterium]|nr:UPF0158 family protein [Bacteroidota bacterium]
MKLTAKQINEIAQELECGMAVYINKENLEIRTILDWDDMYGDTEIWEEELEKIEDEWSDYAVITKMESREAYRVMEDFVDEIDDERMQENLYKILSRKSPFANFKDEIETSDYREQWFDFRTRKYEEYVKEQLEVEGIEFE